MACAILAESRYLKKPLTRRYASRCDAPATSSPRRVAGGTLGSPSQTDGGEVWRLPLGEGSRCRLSSLPVWNHSTRIHRPTSLPPCGGEVATAERQFRVVAGEGVF